MEQGMKHFIKLLEIAPFPIHSGELFADGNGMI
jgi:hypothetical protein